MNKLTKGLAVCGAVLMGAMMFTGCSLSGDETDKLMTKADELTTIFDNQNRKITKAEAVDVIGTARNNIYYMWGMDALSLNYKHFGEAADRSRALYNKENNLYYFDMTTTVVNDVKSGIVLEYHTEKEYGEDDFQLIEKYDYTNQTGYLYNIIEGTENLYLKERAEVVWKPYYYNDFFMNLELEDIREDMIVDIEYINNGYIFTLQNEVTDEVTIENDKEICFYNLRYNLKIKIENNRLMSVEGEEMYVSYDLQNPDVEFEKDAYGNYITKYKEDAILANSFLTFTCEYKYDEDVDKTAVDELYSIAETKYNSEYPQA